MSVKKRLLLVVTSCFVAGLVLVPSASNAQVWVDLDGDSISDFVQVREAGGALDWYTAQSSGGVGFMTWGLPVSDFITLSDFDGDLETDIAVWRGAAAGTAAFYIVESNTGTLRIELFGQTDDDPRVVGDYDGDGEADIAVFRCPTGAPGQCTYYFNSSSGGGVTQIPWGFGTVFTISACPGDFDGDAKRDFCIQRDAVNSPGNKEFVILRSSDFGVEYITWGLATDVFVPGDFDGDGRDDLTVVRDSGGNLIWYLNESTGGTRRVQWGLTGDIPTPGDYDGDGKTDIAVFRPNASPFENYFWVLRSSDSGLTLFEWGENGDYPAATSQVH